MSTVSCIFVHECEIVGAKITFESEKRFHCCLESYIN